MLVVSFVLCVSFVLFAVCAYIVWFASVVLRVLVVACAVWVVLFDGAVCCVLCSVSCLLCFEGSAVCGVWCVL